MSRLIVPIVLAIIFFFSVYIRSPYLNRPLSDHHEWITAHALITVEAWYKGGFFSFYMSPVFNYPNSLDAWPGCQPFGICDARGNLYYVSYPPLGLYVPLFVFWLLGITPSILGLQVINLATHFLCAGLLYLMIAKFDQKKLFALISVPGLGAFSYYLFSAETLWFHSNVYFVEIFMQLPFILALYLFVRYDYFGGRFERRHLIYLLITLFGAAFTEWLGILLCGVIALISLFRWQRMRKVFFVSTFAAVTAVVVAVLIYSQIAGFSSLTDLWTVKYLSRSGHATGESLDNSIRFGRDSLGVVIDYYQKGYPGVFWLLGGLLAGSGYSIVRSKELAHTYGVLLSVVVIALCSVLLHHLLFFSFTTVHDFSVLKGSVVICLLLGVCGLMISRMILRPSLYCYPIFLLTIGYLSYVGYQQYYTENQFVPGAESNKVMGEYIATTQLEDHIVMMPGAFFDPRFIAYAKRTVLPASTLDEVRAMLRATQHAKAQWYNGGPYGGYEIIELAE